MDGSLGRSCCMIGVALLAQERAARLERGSDDEEEVREGGTLQ